jgi:hypothetical protein
VNPVQGGFGPGRTRSGDEISAGGQDRGWRGGAWPPMAAPRPTTPGTTPEWTGFAPAAPAPRAERPRTRTNRAHRRRLVVHAALALSWLALAAAGWPYYRLAPEARLHHPWHAVLKPNGTLGLAYGYAGTAFLLLLLLYSIRKRWRPLAKLGALRRWLSVHIACGLLGPAFITLHAGFRVHGAIAIGYWAMMCVMLSGFVGFYLYRQMPRVLTGHASESEALRAEIDSIDGELAARFDLGPADIEALRRASGADRAATLGLLGSLGFLLVQDFAFALGLRRVPRGLGLRRRGRRDMHRLRELVRQRIVVERRHAFLRQTDALFSYWHAIHKPFATVLYLMMALHIGVAIWLGYAWAWK